MQAETNVPPSPARRVRTGCLTCRRRRRKCDERKPRCLRCEEKSLACHYGVNVSFRGENAKGVGPEHPRQSPRYSRIKFVNNRQESQASESQTAQDGQTQPSSRSSGNDLATSVQFDESTATADIISPVLTQDGYEGVPPDASSWPRGMQQISSFVAISNDKDGIEQLRYYRYNIAPMMDIWDWTQPFGLAVPLLAKNNILTYRSLLSLSARHREALGVASSSPQLRSEYDHAELSTPYDRRPSSHNSSQSFTDSRNITSHVHPVAFDDDAVVIAILSLTKNLLSCSDPRSWKPIFYPVLDELSWLCDYTLSCSCMSSSFWYLFRLDLSVAILDRQPTKLLLNEHVSKRLRECLYASDFLRGQDGLYKYARDILYLLGEATLLSAEFVGAVSGSQGDYSNRWCHQWDQLTAWFSNRPPEILPIFVEAMADSTDGISSILYTTAVAASANIVYHTAAQIMLHCKPRTTRLSSQKPPLAAPLWHLLRVCSITNAIDDPNSWDILVIAALSYAARQLTHSAQQQLVRKTLEVATSSTSGWVVQREIAAIQDHWNRAKGLESF